MKRRLLIALVIGCASGIVGCFVGFWLGLQGPAVFSIIGARFVELTLWLPLRLWGASYLGALSRSQLLLALLFAAMQWGLVSMGITSLYWGITHHIRKRNNS